jgi:hypothetical protein
MDRKYIDDHHIVARYLANQLSDSDREAFEAYYLQNGEMMQELEAAARLKVGLMQLRDAGELDSLLQRRASRTPWLLALAAGVAVAAVGIALLVQRQPTVPVLLAGSASALLDASGRALPLSRLHTIERMRGAASVDRTIDLPSVPQAIGLQIAPEYEASPPRYQVELASMPAAGQGSEQIIAEADSLEPNAAGFVEVYLDSSRVQPGAYRITLSGDAGTSAANASSSFVVRFQASEPSPAQ